MSHNELASTVQNLNQRLIGMTIGAVCLAIALLIVGVDAIVRRGDPQVIKSPYELTPTIEFTTDGSTVDTIYVYTFE